MTTNRLTTLYQVAYLTGGPDRVADTAIAEALGRKAARLDRSGVLHRSSAKPADPFVLAVVETLPKVRIARVREALRESEPMRSLRAELLAGGLIFPAYHWRRAWHAVIVRARPGVWATGAGELLVSRAREDPRLGTGAAGAVALGGIDAYPDRRAARLLTAPLAREKTRVSVSPDDGSMDVTDCSPG
ncbi:TIGR04222 domain-containing membrane protein [Amycolatopsis sp. NPDC089917]|uniref:TIGR04222 domain-containing membrane protein n=1 Tax=Amycolatopsis sp. NPDC089917 TaxID=3155187 RepID=UPI00343CF30E